MEFHISLKILPNACIFASQLAQTTSMILFFRSKAGKIFAAGSVQPLQQSDIQKLIWLFGGAQPVSVSSLTGFFVGPRNVLITPWSSNAVEICQTMGLSGITRI
jgi:phosphoribosylformylglycinamidine synthase